MRNWINLFEAFDTAIPIKWTDHSDDDLDLYQADFQIDDGHFVVQFKRLYYDHVFVISFVRNQELALSGTGSARIVLATVMQAIREFVSARDPRLMRIEMDKKESSRSKLYPRLAAMMLKEFPEFAMTPGETRRHHDLRFERASRKSNYVRPPKPDMGAPLPRAPKTIDEIMADDALMAELLGESAGGYSWPAEITADALIRIVQGYHHTDEDFSDGNLSDRIWMFQRYHLRNISTDSVPDYEWVRDDDMVSTYAVMTTEAPPIIYDPVNHSLIDGTHRVNAYKQSGRQTIPAYVGDESTYEPLEDDD
jgi:hypothetical protein